MNKFADYLRRSFTYSLSHNRGVFLILLLGFLLRFILFIGLQPWNASVVQETIVYGDALGYHNMALDLLKDHIFYSTIRTPGYPFFIAVIYLFFGIKPWIVLLFQIFIDTGIIAIVFANGSILFRRQVGLIASFLYAIDPVAIYYANTLLTDTLFTLIFLSAISILIHGLKKKNKTAILSSGALFGIAIYIRPIAQYFPFIAAFMIISCLSFKSASRLKLTSGFLLICALAIGPWMYRNYQQYGYFSISSLQGYNLLFYSSAIAEARKSNKPIEEVQAQFKKEALKAGANDGQNDYANSKIYERIALNYMCKNWKDYAISHLGGCIDMFKGISLGSYLNIADISLSGERFSKYKNSNMVIWIYNILSQMPLHLILLKLSFTFHPFFYILFIVFTIGSTQVLRQRQYGIFLAITSTMIYFAALTGAEGYERYRLPIIPLYNIFIAIGFLKCHSFLAKKEWL